MGPRWPKPKPRHPNGKGREPGRAHAGSGPHVEQKPQAQTPGQVSGAKKAWLPILAGYYYPGLVPGALSLRASALLDLHPLGRREPSTSGKGLKDVINRTQSVEGGSSGSKLTMHTVHCPTHSSKINAVFSSKLECQTRELYSDRAARLCPPLCQPLCYCMPSAVSAGRRCAAPARV